MIAVKPGPSPRAEEAIALRERHSSWGFAALAIEAAVAPAVGGVIGHYLDRKMAWGSMGVWIGLGIGIALMVTLLAHLSRRMKEKNGK